VSDIDSSLKGEYREAVKKILFCDDQMVILQGKAGAGKTLTLKEVVKGIRKAGNDVFACAPSSGATEVLRERLTPEADTLQQLLVNHDLQRRMKGRVIIVDEAGLISTRRYWPAQLGGGWRRAPGSANLRQGNNGQTDENPASA
jgi:ATP-dependent exoDNAse (exonuclease V) alpha subunit